MNYKIIILILFLILFGFLIKYNLIHKEQPEKKCSLTWHNNFDKTVTIDIWNNDCLNPPTSTESIILKENDVLEYNGWFLTVKNGSLTYLYK